MKKLNLIIFTTIAFALGVALGAGAFWLLSTDNASTTYPQQEHHAEQPHTEEPHTPTHNPQETGRSSTSSFSAIETGGMSSFALMADANLWAWGNNHNNMLGNGTVTNQYGAMLVIENAVAVSASHSHTMVIDTSGNLWGLGANNQGQLGDGTIAQRQYPIMIMEDVYAVSTARSHTMAITTCGTLWAWGSGSGELGIGARNWQQQLTPAHVMDNVAAVSTGDRHTAAITRSGNLYAWGNGADHRDRSNITQRFIDGEVVLTDRDGNVLDNFLSPAFITNDVAAVSAGGSHTMFIKTDGSLWAWGSNEHGQLGNGLNTPTHEPIHIMDNVIAIEAGETHSFAITEDGVLWAWGANGGTLGDGTTTTRHVPTRIMENVAAVSTSAFHTIATTHCGTLWVWGNWSAVNHMLGGDFNPQTHAPMRVRVI